jgi:hypothetical protein
MSASHIGGSRSIAVSAETAPFLIGNHVNLTSYRSASVIRVLYRIRISFATTVNPITDFHGAFGLRWTLHDDADLRADPEFRQALIDWGEAYLDI